jgi:hypothetical protein
MTSIYDKKSNSLHEQPEAEKPICEQYWGRDYEESFKRDLKEYNSQLAKLRTISCGENNWQDGQKLEEGVDYEVKYECCWSYGQGSAWVKVPKEDYDKEMDDPKRITAIPIQKESEESQDEWWDEAQDFVNEERYIFPNEAVRKLKSKFTITRKNK